LKKVQKLSKLLTCSPTLFTTGVRGRSRFCSYWWTNTQTTKSHEQLG